MNFKGLMPDPDKPAIGGQAGEVPNPDKPEPKRSLAKAQSSLRIIIIN